MITNAELREEIIAQLKKDTTEAGFLSALGAQPISYNVDKLKNVTLGGSSTVQEGKVKPLTANGVNELEIVKAKQTVVLVATDESFEYTENVVSINNLVSQAVSRLVADMDLAITLGRSRDTGALIPEFNSHSIVPNASEILLPTPGEISGTDTAIVGALAASNSSQNSIALSTAGYNALAYKVNSNMSRVYPEANNRNVFPFFGQDALLVKSLGYNQTNAAGKNVSPNEILAVTGDFSNVYRGVKDVIIRQSKEGTLGGVNLLEQNATGYIIELFYSFGVENVSDFSVVTSEVDPGE